MPLWQQLLLALAVPLAAGATAWVNGRAVRRDSLVDQLQEEIARLDRRLTEEANQRKELDDRLSRRIRAQEDYIGALRQHIHDEVGPPPPPWPEGL